MDVELILLGLGLSASTFFAVKWYLSGRQHEDKAGLDVTGGLSKPAPARNLRIERQLRLLKVPLSKLQYFVAIVMVATLGGLTMLEIFPAHPSLAGLTVLSLTMGILFAVREGAVTLTNRFEQRLGDALELLHAALRSGATPQTSLLVAADASSGAVRAEFKEIANGLSLGLTIEQSIARMMDLYDSEGVRLFGQALMVKWQLDGDFAMLIKTVSRVVRERVLLRTKISSQLSGAKYSSIMIAIAPYAVVPFFLASDPKWFDTLANHPNGPQFLLAAIVLQVAGFLWLRNIVRAN